MILGSFRSTLGSMGAQLGAIPPVAVVAVVPPVLVIEAPSGHRFDVGPPPRMGRAYVFAGEGGRCVLRGQPAILRVTRRSVVTADEPTILTFADARAQAQYRLVAERATFLITGGSSSAFVRRGVATVSRAVEPSTSDHREDGMRLLLKQTAQGPDAIDQAWLALQRESEDEDDLVLALCGVTE